MAEAEMIESTEETQEETPEVVRDKLLRAQAELVNMQKRYQRQVEEARDQGEARTALAILPIIDDFRRAMAEMSKPRTRKKDILEGIRLVFNKFGSVLEQLTIEGFESEGQQFTYELMEAIAEIPTSKALPGTVVGEEARGYMRRGKLLRPARVAVAVAPKDSSGDHE